MLKLKQFAPDASWEEIKRYIVEQQAVPVRSTRTKLAIEWAEIKLEEPHCDTLTSIRLSALLSYIAALEARAQQAWLPPAESAKQAIQDLIDGLGYIPNKKERWNLAENSASRRLRERRSHYVLCLQAVDAALPPPRKARGQRRIRLEI